MTLMITGNGILGLSLLVGALRHDVTVFNAEGTGAALATTVVPGGATRLQGWVHLVLFGAFVFLAASP